MNELRWVIRDNEYHRVLQFRTGPFSDWQDVPYVDRRNGQDSSK